MEGPSPRVVTSAGLGDLRFDGSSGEDWVAFDRLTEPWRRREIPILTAVGNHDDWGDLDTVRGHLGTRFPPLDDR